MEINSIENKTFNEMKEGFFRLVNNIELLHQQSRNKELKEWLDGQDVCIILNISPRTLQTYRDTGKISYSQINGKIYYKASDIEKRIKISNIKNNL